MNPTELIIHWTGKEIPPLHEIIRTNALNNDRILKAIREKKSSNIKTDLLELHQSSHQRL